MGTEKHLITGGKCINYGGLFMIDFKRKVVFFGFGDTIVHPVKHDHGFGILFYTAKEPITELKQLVKRMKYELYFRDKEKLSRFIEHLQLIYDTIDDKESDGES
jgi:hypothetical protein